MNLPEARTGIRVEVVYARPDRQRIVALEVARGSTAADAVEASGIRDEFPEIPPHPPLGIFSRKVLETEPLRDGDRVEIYRSLLTDPKEARRQRAAAKNTPQLPKKQ